MALQAQGLAMDCVKLSKYGLVGRGNGLLVTDSHADWSVLAAGLGQDVVEAFGTCSFLPESS